MCYLLQLEAKNWKHISDIACSMNIEEAQMLLRLWGIFVLSIQVLSVLENVKDGLTNSAKEIVVLLMKVDLEGLKNTIKRIQALKLRKVDSLLSKILKKLFKFLKYHLCHLNNLTYITNNLNIYSSIIIYSNHYYIIIIIHYLLKFLSKFNIIIICLLNKTI